MLFVIRSISVKKYYTKNSVNSSNGILSFLVFLHYASGQAASRAFGLASCISSEMWKDASLEATHEWC